MAVKELGISIGIGAALSSTFSKNIQSAGSMMDRLKNKMSELEKTRKTLKKYENLKLTNRETRENLISSHSELIKLKNSMIDINKKGAVLRITYNNLGKEIASLSSKKKLSESELKKLEELKKRYLEVKKEIIENKNSTQSLGRGQAKLETTIQKLKEKQRQNVESISDDNIGPFTDKVEILAPEKVDFYVNFKWWAKHGDNITELTKKISEATSKYLEWQKEKLGKDINPNKLIQFLIDAGAKRVEIIEPVFTTLNKTQIASLKTKVINKRKRV